MLNDETTDGGRLTHITRRWATCPLRQSSGLNQNTASTRYYARPHKMLNRTLLAG